MPSLPEPLPHAAATLAVDYRHDPLEAVLADRRLLAVFGFGDQAPATHADPRYLRVNLPVHGGAPFECWRVQDEVRDGRSDDIAWSEDGHLQFGALDVADAGDGDIEQAAEQAYARLQAWLAAGDYPHPLRIWNYLDAITAGEGDEERYRRFCVGRARGIGRVLGPAELPAATAIGHPQATGRLQLYWLAAKTPGSPLENPRQVQAWRYPRQYGPQAPGFARAMLPASAAMPLLVSGTAAVVGHASLHGDSLEAQFEEVLANLGSLVERARAIRPDVPDRPGNGTRLKVYVRDADALPAVDALLRQRLPGVPTLLLHGHVCRRELAVEIDGVHA
ncbi:pteridine-dependent deoxygenase [Thermomonas carbonis]|uniref:Pteridine-dependent deoxygenase n=1 Tax=Thermomonas carbonis TaxID=1463158 RepID=A0A7G9SSM4_9GAMM|nr:pteridine-dependent deoxygenase [Thermomonas carbonis]QNN70849.1 pteridine-dependent deoxygenase [Thermomonas carbonis]